MSLSKVESALVQAFISSGLFLESEIKFENLPFNQPSKSPWAEVYFMPSSPTVATLGDDGEDIFDGLLQVTLNYPTGTGTKLARDHFDIIRNLFTAGARFTYSGQQVIVKSCGRNPGTPTESNFKVIVSIFFEAHINR